MSNLHKMFKSHIKSMRYVFRDGKVAEFVGGRFHTDDEKHIAELMEEIGQEGLGKSKNPSIYVDVNEKEVDPLLLTPEAQLRAKIRAELIAEMQAATNPENNMGSSASNFASSINNTQKLVEGEISGDGAVITELKQVLAGQNTVVQAPAEITQTPVAATQQNPANLVEALKAKLAQQVASEVKAEQQE